MTIYEIEKVLQKFVTRCKYGISSSDISLAAQEIAAKTDEATKEMYPKAFIEWAVINCRAEGNTTLWLYNYDDKTETYLNAGTTDELCEYWKQNIQGK
jgi:hypothetical protein